MSRTSLMNTLTVYFLERSLISSTSSALAKSPLSIYFFDVRKGNSAENFQRLAITAACFRSFSGRSPLVEKGPVIQQRNTLGNFISSWNRMLNFAKF